MKGIGLENIKVFKQEQWLDFNNLTLFTGTNNSGKSSVISTMQLIQDNIVNRDLQALLNAKIRVRTNQNKHGSLDNFIHSSSKLDSGKSFAFSMQNGFLIYKVIIEVQEGIESFGVVKEIYIYDKLSNKEIFWITPGANKTRYEYNFRINYGYFLNRFYEKCENTIRLKNRLKELDQLVGRVKKDKADVEELYDLAHELSQQFLVKISVRYCHYKDPQFKLFMGFGVNDTEETINDRVERHIKSKTSIIDYNIERQKLKDKEENTPLNQIGVFFSERNNVDKIVNEKPISIPVKPSLLSVKEINSLYTDTTKFGIFDFSFLWRDNDDINKKFEQIICSYYETDFKTANRKLSDDLVILLSNINWNLKQSHDSELVDGWFPANLYEDYLGSLSYFGLISIMVHYSNGDSLLNNEFRTLTARDEILNDNEEVLKLKNDGFFDILFSKISDLVFNHINPKITRFPDLEGLDNTMRLEAIDTYKKKRYNFFNDEKPLIKENAYATIFSDILDKLVNFKIGVSCLYISSNRFSVKRSFSFGDKTDFSTLLKQIESLDSHSRKISHKFINKWIKEFGIADELVLTSDRDTGNFKAHLLKDGTRTSLADYGLGTNQLLPVIFGIGKIAYNHVYEVLPDDEEPFKSRTVVIEEPEANLHPALQSKLADMFVEAINRFNVQIIAETHSEYLIRRLQYLTAKYYFEADSKKYISPEDSVIYYFNEEKYVDEKNPKVIKIEITENGSLTDSFGKGFFDEATTLKFDLVRLNRSQYN
ncbi:DUF3696 domain-containing protein [Winogradskyella poriferorum]|uniref:DUF3696 domain-containing protein n=1 Tax=Winogradskyella poriferorum TaxID=307627 RepID=UPI003D6566F8